MKKTIFRLSALVLAMVMLLAMFAGCNDSSSHVDNGINTDNSVEPVVSLWCAKTD